MISFLQCLKAKKGAMRAKINRKTCIQDGEGGQEEEHDKPRKHNSKGPDRQDAKGPGDSNQGGGRSCSLQTKCC